MNFGRVVLTIIAVVWFFPALADETVDECVTNQWHEIERTNSISSLISKLGLDFESDPRSFSRRDQIVLCRQLGLLQENLKQYWPSQTRKFTLLQADIMPDDTQSLIEYQSNVILTELKQDYDFEFSMPFTIVVGYSKESIWKIYENLRKPRHSKYEFEQIFDFSCRSEVGFEGGGFARFGVIVLCPLNEKTNYNVLGVDHISDGAWVTFGTLAHEIFHVVQDEVSGDDEYCMSSFRVCKFVPKWFTEGSATFFAYGDKHRFFEIAKLSNIHRSGLRPSELENLVLYPLVGQLEGDSYDLSVAAIYHLMENRSRSDILAFYTEIAFGAKWSDAFDTAFGMNPNEFYTEFAKLDKLVPHVE